MGLIKNYEVTETLTSWWANKLICHGCMNAVRRLETPASETEVFITHIDNSSPQQFPEFQFLQQGKKRAITDTHSELHYWGGILSWGSKFL